MIGESMSRKKKKKIIRFDRLIVLVLFVCLVIYGAYYVIFSFGKGLNNNKNKSELSKLGFNDVEISNIEKDLSKEKIDMLVSINDKDIISAFINSDGFDSDMLDSYINFYNKNKDVSPNNIIKVVNNNIDTINDFVYDDIIISLIDEKYFIKDNTVRYINYYHDNNSLSSSDIVTNVNSNLDYDFYTNTKSADLSKGNLILVNKFYSLDKDYEPEDLVKIESDYTSWGGYLKSDAYEAFKKMVDAAYEDNIVLYSVSPYRSYQTQNGLYEGYASSDGYTKADTYSARPGYSEHQTGLAVDINSTDDSFAYTKEAKWLFKNAYKYGFILRYPESKEYITGYQYEPWHYRYVGKEIAKEIYDLDITYEEYYAYYIAK